MNEPCKIVIPALKKSYNEKTVLDTSAIELSYGRIYAIIGANGSGKSTLAKVIAGTVQPDGGSRLSLNYNARYMPQKTYAYNMSLKRNVLLGGKDYKRLQHLSAKMGIDKLLKNNSSKLSGGETAKMSLCAVIMSPCKLLLLDEPTAAMDMASTLAAEELIEE